MPVEPRRPTRVFDLHGLLSEIMQCLLILATVAIPIEYLAADQRWLLYGLFVFAVVATAWIRSVCQYLYQFLLLGVLVVVVPMLLPILPPFAVNIWPRLIALPLLIFLFSRAFYLRLKQHEEKPVSDPIQQALVVFYLLAINLIVLRFELTMLSQAYFYVAILYLMLALYRWHRMALASQLQRFLDMPTQPADRIIHFNRMLLIGYALVTLVLLLISPLLHLHDLVPWIGTGLLAFLRWLVRLLSSDAPPEPEPEPEPTGPSGGQDPGLPFEPTETARWLEILQQLFYYLMIVVSVLILLALLGYILYAIYKRFYDSAQPASDKLESLLPSWTEQTKQRVRRIRQRISLPFVQTPSQKIRRCFFRLVEAQMKRGLKVRTDMTPRQIIQACDLNTYPELNGLVALYEAARYGPDISTTADADQVMTWYRNLRKRDLVKRAADGKTDRNKANPQKGL